MPATQTDVLLLCGAYALLGVLVLVVLAGLRLPRWLKAAAVVAVSACYLVVFFATQHLLGWSAPAALPDRFQVLWTRVVEPDPAHGKPGAIHLWIEVLDEANLPSGEPRAYRLPYSPRLAGRVSHAQGEIMKGRPQGGRAQVFGTTADTAPQGGAANAPSPNGVPAGGDPSGGGLLDPAFLGGQSKTVELAPLPAPMLPDKDIPPQPQP